MTNETKAATVSPEDARVDVIKRIAQYGSLPVGQDDVLFLIARITQLQAENAGLRELATKADGYLGLWLHRYWKSATPDDIMRSEVDALIGQLRKAYESKETI